MPQAVDVAQISETLLIDQVVQRLTTRYADLPPDQVAGAVQSAHARFELSVAALSGPPRPTPRAD